MDWDSSIQVDSELYPKEDLAASIQKYQEALHYYLTQSCISTKLFPECSILISGEYSNLTITCCNKKFEVHKALIRSGPGISGKRARTASGRYSKSLSKQFDMMISPLLYRKDKVWWWM